MYTRSTTMQVFQNHPPAKRVLTIGQQIIIYDPINKFFSRFYVCVKLTHWRSQDFSTWGPKRGSEATERVRVWEGGVHLPRQGDFIYFVYQNSFWVSWCPIRFQPHPLYIINHNLYSFYILLAYYCHHHKFLISFRSPCVNH